MAAHPFTLRQLEYFEAVAVHGTLAAAAARCHVSASGLAIALDELEKNLGAQLFVRRKAKGVTLTPLGSRLLSDARVLLGNAGTLAAHASQDGEGIGGTLTLGCYPSLSPFFLPVILEDFGGRHPALTLEFVEAPAPQLHDLLFQGRIEAALMYSAHISGDVALEAVRSYRPYVLVPAKHPLASRPSISLTEVAGEPLIALDLPPSRQNTEHVFASLGLRPRTEHSTMSFELVRCLVGRGLGYSLLFQNAESDVTYDGHRVVSLPLSDDIPLSVVGLAHPARSRLTGRVQALLEFLRTPGLPV